MYNTKIFKIIGLLIIILFIFNSVYFYIQTTENFILLSTLASSAEIKVDTNYFDIFYILNYIFFGGISIILGRILFFKEKTISEEIEKQNVEEKLLKDDEEKRMYKEQRLKEEAEKNELIERILKDLDKQTSFKRYSERLLSNLAKEFEIVQGLFFLKDPDSKRFKMIGNYAFYSEIPPHEFEIGEGLSGQVAKNKNLICIDNIPSDYITVLSGLGKSAPSHLVIFPVIFRDETIGVVELASFTQFNEHAKETFMEISKYLGTQLTTKL